MNPPKYINARPPVTVQTLVEDAPWRVKLHFLLVARKVEVLPSLERRGTYRPNGKSLWLIELGSAALLTRKTSKLGREGLKRCVTSKAFSHKIINYAEPCGYHSGSSGFQSMV